MNSVKMYFAAVLLAGAVGVFSSMLGAWLSEISFDTIAREPEIIAVLPVYDDSHTRRFLGYLELNDNQEGLLLVR